jgi:dihydroflavonol-4-reductase
MDSKRAGEDVVLEAARSGLAAVVLDPASILGPGDPDPGTPHNRLYADMYRRPFFFGSFAGGLAVVDVRDVAAAVVAAIDRGRSGERYLVVGANLTYPDVLRALAARAKRRVWPLRLPPPLVTLAGRITEALAERSGRRPLLTAAYGRLSGIRAYYSNRKGVAELGLTYRPFADTIDAACTDFEQRFSTVA